VIAAVVDRGVGEVQQGQRQLERAQRRAVDAGAVEEQRRQLRQVAQRAQPRRDRLVAQRQPGHTLTADDLDEVAERRLSRAGDRLDVPARRHGLRKLAGQLADLLHAVRRQGHHANRQPSHGDGLAVAAAGSATGAGATAVAATGRAQAASASRASRMPTRQRLLRTVAL